MAHVSKVRVGIVGPSWFMDLWHLPALAAHPNAEVVAVAGKTREKMERVAAKYGITHLYDDYEEMFASGKIDATVIVTPNDLHYPVAMSALSHGLHVMCEKPIAKNAQQAWEMYSAAREQNVVHMTNFTYRDHPYLQKMKQLVADGYIGQYYTGYFSYIGGYGLASPPGWRGSKQRSGAGILGDLGSHLVDMAHMVLGQSITAVSGDTLCTIDKKPHRMHELHNSDQSDDSAVFSATFQNGGQAAFHTSWVATQGAAFQTQAIHLYGSEGTLQFQASGYGAELKGIVNKVGTIERFEHSEIPPLDFNADPSEDRFRPWRLTPRNSSYRFLDAIAHGCDVTPSFYDGYRAQAVIDAVIESSSSRRWVTLQYEK